MWPFNKHNHFWIDDGSEWVPPGTDTLPIEERVSGLLNNTWPMWRS